MFKTTTLDNNITRFVRRFGINKARCAEEFKYIATNNACIVNYSIMEGPNDTSFNRFIMEKYDVDIRPWAFIFSLLHEIGHHMTIGILTDEEYKKEFIVRKIIIPMCETQEEIDELYFNLPAEHLANLWAIDYLDSHIEECWKLQNKYYKIMTHYFKKHNLI